MWLWGRGHSDEGGCSVDGKEIAAMVVVVVERQDRMIGVERDDR